MKDRLMKDEGGTKEGWTRPVTDAAESDAFSAAAVAADPDAALVRSEEAERVAFREAARARELERDIHGVLRLRRRLGLGQITFANRYKILLGTLRNWEQGRATPTSRPRCCWPRSRPTPRGWRGRRSMPAIRATSPAIPAGQPERRGDHNAASCGGSRLVL